MITDKYGRQFKKLRISLTPECNFACLYCVGRDHEASGSAAPNTLARPLVHQKLLARQSLASIVQRLHDVLQLNSVRLTGGEPLIHPEVVEWVHTLRQMGIGDIRMTTNGFLLAEKAVQLKQAGLTAVNVSLDALDPVRFLTMTRRRGVNQVVEGIDAAIDAGLQTRINTVVMRNGNESEIVPLLNFATNRKIAIRFLELMAMGNFHSHLSKGIVTEQQILNLIAPHCDFEPIRRERASTARYWQTSAGGVFGIIANESSPFCSDCDRLRLDGYGNMYGCLSSLKAIALHPENLSTHTMEQKLQQALHQKQAVRFVGNPATMMSIGG